jgi:cell division initiation protein
MARKKDEGGVGGAGRLTPVDVQQIQFRRALRGYDEQEVDDFLDRITEELTQLIDERRSATERAGILPTVRVASAGDAAAASRQAEELVRQARERADAIIRDAQQRAAATTRGAGPAPAAGGSNAAIAGFVAKEREFLQRLAALVQGHAEGVKTMVASARDSGPASPAGASAVPGGSGSIGGNAPGKSGGAGAGASSILGPGSGSGGLAPGSGEGAPDAGRSESTSGASASQRTTGGIGAAEPVEPAPESPRATSGGTAPATEPRSAPAPGGSGLEDAAAPRLTGLPQPPPDPSRPIDAQDSSLRELFWGED